MTITKLSDLMQLDYDTIAAYQSAIERLDNPALKNKLTEFMGDHEQHVQELGQAIRNEGGTPPTAGDARQILTQGKAVIASLMGDKAILMAMRANEVITNARYAETVESRHANDIQTLLQRGLADERRHKAWMDSTLGTL